MARKLDKNRKYGNIFGIHEYGGVFEQDGCCFDGAGNEVGPGITPVVEEPLRPGAAGPAATEPVAATPALAGNLAEELAGLHPAQIAKLVTEAGLTPITGTGSKKANIAQLLEADSAAG